MEGLTSLIYHERQQPGSMLCAQHALNNLLQGQYFTAPDLAHIAKSIDAQERESLDASAHESTSANMDDTGFFSVQVMENALSVWGLNLIRWQSEQMRPYHATPYTQLGYILNLQQHWFTLRRFGPAEADMNRDTGEGHWYNLDSTHSGPEWISQTYLGMFIEQAERDGYSVFVICQADVSQPLGLARTEADIVAGTLTGRESERKTSSRENVNYGEETTEEDDDWQLQAALQASLMNGGEIDEEAFQEYRTSFNTRDENVNEDVIAASITRNRTLMERMRREQEAALRMTYEEEMTRFENGPSVIPVGREEIADTRGIQEASITREEREDVNEDEDAELEAALKASLESSTTTATTATATEPVLDMEEMRRRRLAKFGS